MKNIILQHWSGDLSPLCLASMQSFTEYASYVGADYRMIRGKPFRNNLSLQCQKLYMLEPEFDNYNLVLMIDTDMFVKKGLQENIFEIPGLGMHTWFQSNLFKNLGKKFPKLYDPKYPFWGGAIYKTTPEIRASFRKYYNEDEMQIFSNSSFVDEGIMHRLASLARFNETPYLPNEFKWCHCSYRSGIDSAAFIHVRTKINENRNSPKRTKWENYQSLKDKGIL